MSTARLPEVWLRGPLPSIPALLQPVAHTLLQAFEEITELMTDFENSLLWQQPSGLASVGFHLQHIAGVQDRLFTYARGIMLNEQQLEYLRNEGRQNDAITVNSLLENLKHQTNQSLFSLNS